MFSLSDFSTAVLIISETAKDFVDENITCETIGSHGDLPPMSDDGRRAEGKDQHAIRHGSQPKPTSQSIGKWADIEDDIDEYDTPAWGAQRSARCETVADTSLLSGAGTQRAARCETVADQSLPRGAGAESAARCETVATKVFRVKPEKFSD